VELTFDWVGFQEVFQPRRAPVAPTLNRHSPIRIIVEGQVVREVFCEGDDLSSWIGQSLEQLQAGVRGREFVVMDREAVDQAISRAFEVGHFHQQLDLLRGASLKQAPEIRLHGPEHFWVEALKGNWSKILPSSYALFFRFEGATAGQERDFIVVVRRGELAAFHRPDLSFLSAERKKNPADLVKYLSDKYLVPVQGFFLSEALWNQVSTSDRPWRDLAQAVRKNEVRLHPWRWSVAALLGVRGLKNG
jgi:hypothetical protein